MSAIRTWFRILIARVTSRRYSDAEKTQIRLNAKARL